MFMKAVWILTIIICVLLFSVSVETAADDDCGCGDDSGWGEPGSNDGRWDTGWSQDSGDTTDGTDSSCDTGTDSGSTSDADKGTDSGYGNDDTSTADDSGSEGDSGSSSLSSSSGGLVEEAILRRMKGDDLFENGLYSESLEAYEKAISYDPYALKSWIGKGQVLLALARPAGAADAFERAIHLDPGNAATYVQLGDALAAGGEYVQAVENYLKALAMNPNLPGVEEKIADTEAAVVKAGQTEEATPVITTPPEVEVTSMETVTLPGEDRHRDHGRTRHPSGRNSWFPQWHSCAPDLRGIPGIPEKVTYLFE